MTGLTLWCLICAGFAGASFGLRANMMKPEVKTWPTRPLPVRLATVSVAIVLWAYVFSVVNGDYRPTQGEAALLPVLALYGGVTFVYLFRLKEPAKARPAPIPAE